MPRSLWNDAKVEGLTLREQLVYRSRLLGADRTVCNIYGGNTSVKADESDFRGRTVRVLWVKGSGSDLATMTLRDVAGLRLGDVLPLFERESLSDEAMVDYLAHCLFYPNSPRPSIETLMHAFVPYTHVDHTHPDAIISLATCTDGETHVRKLYVGHVGWIPYVRPGFLLGKVVGQQVRQHPRLEGIVFGKHGLVC